MKSKKQGCLFGLAIGDGFGYPVEFMSIEEIYDSYPPNGPQSPQGNPIIVSDDTQMAISVGKALMYCAGNYSLSILEQALRSEYLRWYDSPENNRAPGMTCLSACERLAKNIPWEEATNRGSKGCGANMRVMPVALLDVSWDEMSVIAQFQSALTHAHPTALAASDITAATIRFLLEGVAPSDLLQELYAYIEMRKNQYWSDYLGNIWQRPPFNTAEEFIHFGWEECRKRLDLVQFALVDEKMDLDACSITGAGWVAEEAFATALYCFLAEAEAPVKCLRKAVLSSGDSDSIACIAGAFVGAYQGIDAFPKDWVERIEYKTGLKELADFFSY